MLAIKNINLFESNACCYVCTVNCKGTLGAGIAKEFKNRYPDYNIYYKNACRKNDIKVGEIDIYDRHCATKPNLIVSFPTKDDWRYNSKIEWIEEGLDDFVEQENLLRLMLKGYNNLSEFDVSFPLLGCNNGGLKRDDVLSIMKDKLKDSKLNILICDYFHDNYTKNKYLLI